MNKIAPPEDSEDYPVAPELEEYDVPDNDDPLIELQKYLDEQDLARMEWERVQNDLFPGAPQEVEDESRN